MSIQTVDEGGGEQNSTPSGTLYVPDGIYAPDIPSEADQSPATISAQSNSEQPEPTPLSPTNNTPSKKLCGVCKEKEYKYKCTRCELPYCSIACSTLHKATHPLPTTPTLKPLPPNPAKPPPTAARAGTVSASTQPSLFAALTTSTELQALFTHYPKLSSQLLVIWEAMQPPSSPNPDLYHKLTGKMNNSKAWNQDKGMEKGVEALRKAREAWGKDGEGVREFGELVLRAVRGVGEEELIRQELERENAKIIRGLMEGEL